jgi:GT2 family glycosyltransferase
MRVAGVDGAPVVTVIVLNYNGAHLIRPCLDALAKQDIAEGQLAVWVVDNASQDGSAEIVQQEYPWVRTIRNSNNDGFAGGNNVALREVQTPLVALLNNDARPEPDWIRQLVGPFQQQDADELGAVTSKIVFVPRFVELQLHTPSFRPGALDGRDLGVRIYRVHVDGVDVTEHVLWEHLAYGPEGAGADRFRWTRPAGRLPIPVALEGQRPTGDLEVRIELAAETAKPIGFAWSVAGTATAPADADSHAAGADSRAADDGPISVGADSHAVGADSHAAGVDSLAAGDDLLSAGGRSGASGTSAVGGRDGAFVGAAGSERSTVEFTIPGGVPTWDVINNAGSKVFLDGYGADRGFQEIDRGQYDQAEEVFAFCGGAVCVRTDVLRDAGFFDDDFFLYYEDTDLSWRIRAAGWSIRYEAAATVRHIHSASSGEWSPLFTFHVDRNRLLMLTKNATAGLAWREVVRYPLTTASLAVRELSRSRHTRRRPPVRPTLLRLRVTVSYLRLLPRMLARRRTLTRHAVVARGALQDRWLSSR